MKGVEIIDEWTWYSKVEAWGLRARLWPDIAEKGPVSSPTDVFVLVENTYPEGGVSIHPAQENGLEGTYPHMVYSPPLRDLPWRREGLCLTHPRRSLQRFGGGEEPKGFRDRLAWYFRRALHWFELASRGRLLRSGDHFVLPVRRLFSPWGRRWHPTVAFHEGEDQMPRWEEEPRGGGCSFVTLREGFWIVREFRVGTGRSVRQVPWGNYVSDLPEAQRPGVWVRLDEVPTMEYWRPPNTWGELRKVCDDQGVNLDLYLSRELPGRSKRAILMVGFPVPDRVGEPAKQYHWWSALVEVDEDENEYLLDNARSIPWLKSENWSPMEIATRGKLNENLSDSKVLLVGAGALGSQIAELLVRGSVDQLLIMDGDVLETGNLIRHTLSLDEVGEDKAVALKERLESLSPHAEVQSFPTDFPTDHEGRKEAIQEADVVIDCTGEDGVLQAMASFPWGSEKHYLSFSISDRARRLYAFSAYGARFPQEALDQRRKPWFAVEEREREEDDIQWEGTGCHDPVFQTRQDDIALLSGIAVKWAEKRHLSISTADPDTLVPCFSVFEQKQGSLGIHEANLSEYLDEEEVTAP